MERNRVGRFLKARAEALREAARALAQNLRKKQGLQHALNTSFVPKFISQAPPPSRDTDWRRAFIIERDGVGATLLHLGAPQDGRERGRVHPSRSTCGTNGSTAAGAWKGWC